ncbi:MAG: hypothetical protein GKR88_08530 [Flavobacteriaceae bacterium]|nr:MAG: hypothetical protein GKR88_08530 [Flavobacteriaceae bacterium]
MNNLKKIGLLLILTLTVSSLVFVSCENEQISPEQNISQVDIDTKKIDKLLENYKPSLVDKASKISDDKLITFEVVKNLKTNEISIENEQVVSFFPIDERSSYYNHLADGYQVDYDRGGDGSNNWSASCYGKWSCGKLIAKCLDQGGCATICQAPQEERSTERIYSSVLVTYLPIK